MKGRQNEIDKKYKFKIRIKLKYNILLYIAIYCFLKLFFVKLIIE